MQRIKMAILFMLLLFCFSYTLPRWADWNQNSRLDLVLAIVDQGTFSIDDYYQNTGDYALYNGHYYSDKAPGTAFLGVPPYWLFKHLVRLGAVEGWLSRLENNAALASTLAAEGTGLQSDKVYVALALTFVTFFAVAVPSALLGVLLYLWTGWLTQNPLYRLGVPLIYALLTNAFSYSNLFYGHQIVAVLLFASFFILFRIERGEISPAWSVLSGFLTAYAVITEYPVFLIGVGLLVYAVWILPDKRWLGGYALAGLLPAIGLMAYNYAIFGTVLPVGYLYSELYTEQHSSGFLSLSYPRLDALWGITFGSYRGLFFVSPILLLALAGFVVWWRQRTLRRAWWLCMYATLSFLVFNSSSLMWQGGWAVGPRYLLPMLPFTVLGVGFFFQAYGAKLWARVLTLVLGAWSFFVVWTETIGGQHFPDWTPNPLFHYSLPRLVEGDVARNIGTVFRLSGWASLIPLFAGLAIGMVLLARDRFVSISRQTHD